VKGERRYKEMNEERTERKQKRRECREENTAF
jgi:hypothetical protein